MSSWAKPGMKCVYTGAIPMRNKKIIPLIVGGVYTIRDVFEHPTRHVLGVRLVEVRNAIASGFGIERGYLLENFRPLVTRTQEQDMELFIPLLNSTKAPERAKESAK